MTDFTRVENRYYDSKLYNSTLNPIPAQTDDNLLFPLLNDSNNWSVGLNKAKIDLSTIPLTNKNLPLKQYEVGIKYGSQYSTAYVRQLNSNNNNYVWNAPQGSTTITKYQYTLSTLVSVGMVNVAPVCLYVYQYLIDDFQNIYIAGSNISANVVDTLFVIDQNENLLTSLPFTKIMHIYMDRGQHLYVTDEGLVPSVFIYSNNNAEASVQLTKIATLTTTFGNLPLTNLLFCVADNTIIVGYNANDITIYNSSFQPISDSSLTGVVQMQSTAQISGTAGTFAIVDLNESFDNLIGTKTQEFFDVITNTQLTVGDVVSSAAISSSGYVFGVGTDNYTYATAWPIASPPANFFQVNNDLQLQTGSIFADKTSSIYAMDTANNFLAFNYGTYNTAPNTWYRAGTNFKPTSGTTFINIDYQSSTNLIFGVDSSNNLYSSKYAVYPQDVYYVTGGTLPLTVTMQGVGHPLAGNVMDNAVIRSGSVNYPATGFTHIGAYYYLTNQNTGAVGVFNVADFSYTGTTFPCTEMGGQCQGIRSLNYGGTSAFMVRNVSIIAVYNAINGSLISKTAALGITAADMCDLGDSTHFFATYSDGSGRVYNYTTNPATFVSQFSLGAQYPGSICSNINDTSYGGVASVFMQKQTSPFAITSTVNQIGFTDNTFTAIAHNAVIVPSNGVNYNIQAVQCNPNFGKVYVAIYNGTSVTWNIYYQSNSYSGSDVTTFPYLLNASLCYVDTNIVDTPVFQEVNTGGFQMYSCCVSRTQPNTLYAIGKTDNLIYKGTWNATTNACTFTRIVNYTQTYDYLATCPLLNPTVYNAKVDCFTINSQAPVGSVVSLNGNVASLAKNDVTLEYLVANQKNNNIISYSATNFTSNWTQTLTGIFDIFAKNGVDIDAGPANIYYMSVLLNAVNDALALATQRINQQASISLTPPTISLDYSNGLCTLDYEATLTSVGNGILLNIPLLAIIAYPNSLDPVSQLQLLSLPLSSSSLQQTAKSIYLYNKLDKILLLSNTIYVTGAFVGQNETTQVITDIDVPTDSFIENIGQVLYYQPNFIRSYFMNSNLGLQRIQLNLNYSYVDFSQYQLMVNPGQNYTCKLQFIKKY